MIRIEPTAIVDKKAKIGEDTRIWNFTQIRENAVIGSNCNIANGVYIDKDVKIGNNVTIQNKSSLYRNLTVENDVFIGPHVCFLNDKNPRSGVIRNLTDIFRTVKKGATIGANSVVMPDVNIGEYAMVGAGSVVTKDVPPHGLVYGNPAELKGFVCKCGAILAKGARKCQRCNEEINIPGNN